MKLPRTCPLLLAALVAAAAFHSPAASAQSAPLKTEQDRRQAYEKAHDAFAAGDFLLAHRIFSQLWAERPSYDIAGILGQTELQLKRYRDAAEHIEFSLRNWPPRERLESLEKVREGLTMAKRHVGTLRLSVRPPGARVWIDGRAVATAPVSGELFVNPGVHTLQVEREGYTALERSLEIGAGQEQTLELVLESAPDAPATPAAASVTANTGAAPRSQNADSAPAGSRLNPAILAFGGATILAATAAGTVFALKAGSAENDINRYRSIVGRGGCQTGTRTECDKLLEAAESKDRNTNASYLMFGIAGGAAAFTLGYYLWPRESEQRAVSVSWLPEGGAFAAYRGAL